MLISSEFVQVVKLKAFSKFDNTTEALAAATALVDSKLSKGGQHMLAAAAQSSRMLHQLQNMAAVRANPATILQELLQADARLSCDSSKSCGPNSQTSSVA